MPQRLQFNLRALLVAVTVIAIWLGIEASRARRQRAVVLAIQQAGGAVRYSWELDDNDQETGATHPPGPPWLRQIVGDDYFQTVVAVFIVEVPIKDQELPPVEYLPDLRTLAVGTTRIGNASLPRISRTKRLRFLDIGETAVTDAGMRSIAQITTLKILWVGTWAAPPERAITDSGIRRLAPLVNLEVLHLAGRGVTDSSVPALGNFKKLRELRFTHTAVTNDGIERLAKSLPKCEVTCGEP